MATFTLRADKICHACLLRIHSQWAQPCRWAYVAIWINWRCVKFPTEFTITPQWNVGRLFERASSSIYPLLERTDGIRPPKRRRSQLTLTLVDCEEISRGLIAERSLRSIARHLGRAASTISREVWGKPKLSDHQKQKALERLQAGVSAREIGRDMGISHPTFSRLRWAPFNTITHCVESDRWAQLMNHTQSKVGFRWAVVPKE